ncbi:NAD(P)-dependent oxidoreductase [Candidatus Woesearchaeota archaeon]|jgi:nucleoside-diphosphate-sugar epimerase|nr:NAD(P)-dependent oxidoreductase [Candidatus Woesearchaeota archaeon]MBT4764993.1 NAD(P)-dependent oxidoreductase [bacterium]MBT7557311.1 NAD(P)-dependent oxidoreductase [Candidatus Woesearchaeota archaeon]
MRILLTGATGFLGSNLLKKLLNEGHELFCVKRKKSLTFRIDEIKGSVVWCDIETLDIDSLFLQKKIECVIHCATNYGKDEKNPIETIEANLILPLKLLSTAIKYNVGIFINTDTILDKRINIYSLSKKQFVEWLKRYSDNILIINLSLEHFFGQGDNLSKFVSYMINKLLDDTVGNVIKLTPGLQRRNFIYIDDVVNVFIALINNYKRLDRSYNHFNIGTNYTITIREFLELVKKLCSNKNTFLDFGALPYRSNEIMSPVDADIKKLSSFGWMPEVLLEDGLKRTIDYEINKKVN